MMQQDTVKDGKTQYMILQLLQELIEDKSWAMEAHAALFLRQKDLIESLAKAQAAKYKGHEEVHMPRWLRMMTQRHI